MRVDELAKVLGISRSMAYAHKKIGMPVHSIEAARKWRATRLNMEKTKQYRADGNAGGRRRQGLSHGDGGAVATPPRFNEFIQATLPGVLFQSAGIAAVTVDAGLALSGAQVLELAATLFEYYMLMLGGADEALKFAVPEGLQHPLGSDEYAAEAKRIGGIMRELAE